MNIKKTKLDELDVEFFNALPFLIDVFASSFTKIKEIILAHFEQLEKDVVSFTNNNSNWKVANNIASFWPFYFSDELKPRLIETLAHQFGFEKSIIVKEAANGTTAKSFYVSCGFGYWYSDEAEDNKPFLYFGIYRLKADTEMIPLAFYNSLDIADYKRKIHHPAQGDNWESIEFRVFEINADELNKALHIFSKQVLQPYLKELKKTYRKK